MQKPYAVTARSLVSGGKRRRNSSWKVQHPAVWWGSLFFSFWWLEKQVQSWAKNKPPMPLYTAASGCTHLCLHYILTGTRLYFLWCTPGGYSFSSRCTVNIEEYPPEYSQRLQRGIKGLFGVLLKGVHSTRWAWHLKKLFPAWPIGQHAVAFLETQLGRVHRV